MGRIQTNIGLISGLPIGETVDKLMQIAARPRDNLVARTKTLQDERVAVTELSALLLAVRYVTDNLGEAELFDQTTATSNNESALAAWVTGNPAVGTYQFTPLRLVQSQQWLAQGLTSDSTPLGAGTFSVRFGDHVQRSASLELLAGGEGFARGSIRITDRSGATADIDLSTAQTLEEVLDAISSNTTIDVTATSQGDLIHLTDNTGETASNLKVQEVGDGTTAASLGLAGINAALSQADGQDMVSLSGDVLLGFLNDGNGVNADRVLDDIEYTLRDGTNGTIDLSPILPGGSTVDEEVTLDDVLEVLNAAAPGKLSFQIAADGKRLEATDLTAGGGTFTLESLFDSTALDDLGLSGTAVGGTVTGRRLLGGMQSVLLSSLNGGSGLGTLGDLALTDRSGATDTVDLSGAETLEDVIDAINAATVGITASVNDARNGIVLVDTTGSSASHLIIANGDATLTAEKLGIEADVASDSVSSGDMHLQVISYNTRLSALNGGLGVARGKFTITDSMARQATIDLSSSSIQTVGDVIRAINGGAANVLARINATGDGIEVQDVDRGGVTLAISDINSTAAADLHLTGAAVTRQIDGQPTQVVDGATTYQIELDADDTLQNLRDKINDLGAHVQAAIFLDGSSRPYRLSLTSEAPGLAGQLVLDISGLDLSLEETIPGRNALLAFGALDQGGVLISSSANVFENVISGVRLEAKQASSSPVSITVEPSDTNLMANMRIMVENYNRFRERLNEQTAYDPETNKAAILTGDATALRLDIELSYLLSGRFLGAGRIQSLAELGISLKDDGTLEFDETKFQDLYGADPEAVEQFLTDQQFGLSAKFGRLADQLTDEDTSLLTERLDALDRKIEENQEKVDFLNERLTRERNRMLLEFYNLEVALAKLQSSLGVLSSLKPLEPLVTSRRQ